MLVPPPSAANKKVSKHLNPLLSLYFADSKIFQGKAGHVPDMDIRFNRLRGYKSIQHHFSNFLD